MGLRVYGPAGVWGTDMARAQLYPVKKVIGFDDDLLQAVDAWRRNRTPIPNVSDAIRQILSKHLRQKGYLAKVKAGEAVKAG